MFALLTPAYRLFIAVLISACCLFYGAAIVCGQTSAGENIVELRKQHIFSMLACVTWWSHDAVGYHPAMCLYLENISGHPLTNGSPISTAGNSGEIPFQGRFTDIRTGDVTVAREYRRGPIHSHERFQVFLVGPKSYDLPIDSSLWPSLECKAMCRINDGDPEELFLGHLAHITMTDEDAQAQLVAQAGRSPLLVKSNKIDIDKIIGADTQNSKDLASHPVASTTSGDNDLRHKPIKHLIRTALQSADTNDTSVHNGLPKSIPAVGQDFYAFEKLYGPASEFQASNGGDNLTWTHYKSSGLLTDVFVASRNANKADIIILNLSAATLKDKDILLLGKQLAGCGKADPITPFSHSVRYTSAGRNEFMTTAIRECRILSFKIPHGTVIAVSRLAGDLENSIVCYGQRVNFLRFISAQANNSD